MAVPILDPTGEQRPAGRHRAPRPPTSNGLVLGLIDISKPREDVFLDRVEPVLVERGLEVRHCRKPTFSKPAPDDLRREVAQHCQGVIQAVAD